MTQCERDLGAIYDRRGSLAVLAGAGLWVAGCREGASLGREGPAPPPGELGWHGSYPEITATADGVTCVAFPGETEGPFPADGRGRSTVTSVLGGQALQRSDIRSSFGELSGSAEGVSLDLELTLVDVDDRCAPKSGHAIYVWHCDAEGRYSLYNLPDQNYLRGLQVTNAAGKVHFRTVFPGAYRGRFPHIHFEVFASPARATSGREALLTSQLALPASAARAVYASSSPYRESVENLAETPLARDMIFADNTPAQLAAQMLRTSGSPAQGYRARAAIGLTRRYGASAGV